MKTKQLKDSCLIAGTLLLSACASATDLGEGLVNESESLLLKNSTNKYSHWNGVGKMHRGEMPWCTASLLDTRKGDDAVGPAYILTNAHCVGGVDGPPSSEPESVKFNYFNDTPDTYKSYPIKETMWRDYIYADLAIMELDVPLATLLEDGITPLQLASEWTRESSDILIVGAPQYLPEAGLRLAACTQEATGATLIEGGRVYSNTLKNRCREIRPGSSGSPVLDRETGHIVSVLATSTLGATIDEKCFSNAPCEVKQMQPTWAPDTHYSHPADQLSSCFSEGIFTDISNACTSDAPFKVIKLKYGPTQYLAMPRNADSPDPVLNAHFSLSTPYYRFKAVRDEMDCRSALGYSEAIDAKDAEINAPISRDPGMHYLCVIGVDSSEQRPDMKRLKNAWINPAQLIERTPVRLPEPTITLSADWNYKVAWRYLVPTLFRTFYYASPAADTDCSKIKIADYIDTFDEITFKAEQLPLTLCSRNQDFSGRYSKVRTDLLALP